MKLLLDTHVWIWSQESVDQLGKKARRALVSARNQNIVCAVSVLEIARLVAAGHVSVAISLGDWISRSQDTLAAESLPMDTPIALEAYALPEPFHRDPADRILVAAARVHDFTLITADQRILAYGHVRTLDARS